jgi:hypothetical protein
MSSVKRPATLPSITDKPGAPVTPKDNALAGDVQALRKAIRATPNFQRRLHKLAESRPIGLAPRSTAEATAGISYWSEIAQLSNALGGLWSEADLDDLAAKLLDGRTFDGDTLSTRIPDTITFAAGRQGRGRSESPSTVAFVARSLALQCDGLSATVADDQVADENCGVKDRQMVAIYRKRLRDRLAEKPRENRPVATCDHRWCEPSAESCALSLQLPQDCQWHRSARECRLCGQLVLDRRSSAEQP